MNQHTDSGDASPNNVPSVLPAVGPNESGFGHPYAPQDFPNPGDYWKWKVGSRISKHGDYYLARYVFAPEHLPPPNKFASKSALERYIVKLFPDTDLRAFFAEFSWNIPARKPDSSISEPKASSSSDSLRDMKGDSEPDSQSSKCPAGRKSCKGLLLEAEKPTLPCDMCCTQSDFCQYCSCILCCKTVKSAFRGYSYFRCETVISEEYICGHVAHLNCALRCNLAGKLGGFKLDAAYYCRRCDGRSDLVPHAAKLLEICKSIESASELDKILQLVIAILRGSERETARVLLRKAETAFNKLGSPLNCICESEKTTSITPPNGLSSASEVKAQTTHLKSLVLETEGKNNVKANPPDEQEVICLKLEDEIYATLHSLKKSQELEYQQAEEKLNSQKSYLINLEEQLQYEKSQLAGRSSSAKPNDAMLDIVNSRTKQIKMELKKFKEMQEVYKRFPKVPNMSYKSDY